MCLIVFAWRPDHAQPLIVAANRDEFYARPSLPLAQWPEAPHVHAGRDLEAGGSWLGIGANGRFAALTNIRDPHQPPARKSRGELVAGFLTGVQSLEDYLADVVDRSPDYAGFNLLLGNHHELWHFNARMSEPVMLESGVYGLSNAGLDTPWPKLLKAKTAWCWKIRRLRGCWSCLAMRRRRRLPSCRIPAWGLRLNHCCRVCLLPARVTGRGRVQR